MEICVLIRSEDMFFPLAYDALQQNRERVTQAYFEIWTGKI